MNLSFHPTKIHFGMLLSASVLIFAACGQAEKPPVTKTAASQDQVHPKKGRPTPLGPLPAASPISDSASKFDTGSGFNYGLKLKSLQANQAGLETYKGKNLLIFYFSATCPHCQQAFPKIQALAQEMQNKGLHTIAVASGSNHPTDIANFNKTQKNTVPSFQDSARELGNKYGTGSVPILLWVDESGNYRRYTDIKESTTKEIKHDFEQEAAKKG